MKPKIVAKMQEAMDSIIAELNILNFNIPNIKRDYPDLQSNLDIIKQILAAEPDEPGAEKVGRHFCAAMPCSPSDCGEFPCRYLRQAIENRNNDPKLVQPDEPMRCPSCGCIVDEHGNGHHSVADCIFMHLEKHEPTVKRKTELGDELCNFCPLDSCKKGVVSVPGGCSAGCEGSRCDDAYEGYLESIGKPIVSKSVEELAQAMQNYSRGLVAKGIAWPKEIEARKSMLAEIESAEIKDWTVIIQSFLDAQKAEMDKEITKLRADVEYIKKEAEREERLKYEFMALAEKAIATAAKSESCDGCDRKRTMTCNYDCRRDKKDYYLTRTGSNKPKGGKES